MEDGEKYGKGAGSLTYIPIVRLHQAKQDHKTVYERCGSSGTSLSLSTIRSQPPIAGRHYSQSMGTVSDNIGANAPLITARCC
jgi:hypothetical protein